MHCNRLVAAALKLSAASLALIVGVAGLALAGVHPAKQAFERAGLGDEHSRSDAVKAVIDATPPSDRGCEFGHRVAEAAKGSPLPEQARAACTHGEDPDADSRTRADGGSGDSAGHEFGKETSERAHSLAGASVEQRRQFGHETAERAKQLGGAPAAPEKSSGPPAGTPASPPDDTPAPHGSPGGPPDGAGHGPG